MDDHAREDAALTTAELQEKDNGIIHPWEDIGLLGSQRRTIMDRSDGIYVSDSDGNRLIDGPAGMWCVNIGYGRQEMADAIAAQALEMPYGSPWSVGTAPAARFAERLAAYAPGDLNKVMFTTGGSTAVDSALRFAFFYNNALGRPQKKQIISRKMAYHGSTYLSASCAGKMPEKVNMDGAPDLVHHLSQPKPLLRPKGMSVEAFCDARVAELEDKILEIGADKVAVFIAEPVMGSGGVVIPPPGYHAKTLEVCRRHDVLYISDEVVTAFGRLGHIFASEDVFGVVPDMITTAKGLTSGYVPMGATLISDRLIDAVKASGANSKGFFNGFTYSGHPVAAAAGMTNLDIIEREGLLAHVRALAPHFKARLEGLADLKVVAEVRAIGLMAGIECCVDTENPDPDRDIALALTVDRISQEMGLYLRPVYNMCVMSPPLVINADQVDEIAAILRKAIGAAMAEHGIS